MVGLAVYAAMLAYGRLSKSFGPMHWIVILFIALLTSLLSAPAVGGNLSDAVLLLAVGIQIALLAALYAGGVLVGRILDRDKYADYGDDEEAA